MKFQKLAVLSMLILFGGVAAACNGTLETSGPLVGTWMATEFRVTPAGQAEINVLDAGGILTIVIDADNKTSGSLTVPASVSGGLIVNMTGTVTVTGSNVKFVQTTDSFIRDLTWTRTPNTLIVIDETAEGSRYTITLTRQ
jgi:hypothetical protein